MPESVIQRSFAAGELTPAAHARADLDKYAFGLKTCRNFFIHRSGGASNRAGTRFVDAAKDVTASILLRFITSTPGVSVIIEAGQGYFRFYQDGAQVTVTGVPAYNGGTAYVPGDLVSSGGVNYYCIANTTGNAPPNASFWYALTGSIMEVPHSYTSAQLLQLHWVQSNNLITLTHHTHPPRELVYGGLQTWVLRDISTAPTQAPPTGPAGLAGAAGALTYRYVITAAKAETYEESLPSAVATIAACVAPTQAAPNTLTWVAAVGAIEYYVYCDPYGNGVYGFIGTASTVAFADAGFVPDFNVTPPIARVLFGTTSNYPSASAYYQQRRFFANTDVEPDGIWGSRIGFPSNFGISSPLQDDDAVTFAIAGNNQNAVRHLVATKSGLVTMTDSGEWTITGGGGAKQPITPSSIDAEQETYVGIAADVQPVIIGNAVIYLQARGNILRELRFNQDVEGLAGRDLTIFATHLFEGKTVVSLDFQQVIDSIVWCALSDGGLIGMTYISEQDVWGWHRHDIGGGLVKSVIVAPEADQDVLYLLVERTINDVVVRYVERLESRVIRTGFHATDSFFVDCGLSYIGTAADVFSGLDHLEGKVVSVLADGVVAFDAADPEATAGQIAQFTVTGGSISIDTPASVVHIGLPITAQLQTLDLDVQGSNLRDKKKSIPTVSLLIERSSRVFKAGPTSSDLREYDQASFEDTTSEFTGLVEMSTTADAKFAGSVLVQQTNPLPITVLGIIPNVQLGG